MDEGDPGAVGTQPGSPAGKPEPGPIGRGDRRPEIGNAEREVVDAFAVSVQESGQRPRLGERLHQLHVGAAHTEKRDRRILTGHRGAIANGEPEDGGRNACLAVQVPDDDGDVGEAWGHAAHTTAAG